MENYKKGKNVEEELTQDRIPIEILPEKFLWMHVKGGTKVSNVVEFAEKAFESGEHRSVVWSGSGGGVPKTISCAEIMKRKYDVNQVTRLTYQKIEEYWDPILAGLEPIIVTRRIPAVHIFLSLDTVDSNTLGYQQGKKPPKFWPGHEAVKPKKDVDYVYGNKSTNSYKKTNYKNQQRKSNQSAQNASNGKSKPHKKDKQLQPGPSTAPPPDS